MELSPGERVALDYCAPRGVPLSVFLGRAVYPGEPAWTPEDIEAALWWNAKCTGCGQHPDEAFGPGHEERWNAEVSGHCDACRALHRAATVHAGRDDLDQTVGARYRIWPDKETSDGRVDESAADGSEA